MCDTKSTRETSNSGSILPTMNRQLTILLVAGLVGGAIASLAKPITPPHWSQLQGRIQVELSGEDFSRFELVDPRGRHLASGNLVGRTWFDLPVFRGAATLRLVGRDTTNLQVFSR